MDFRSARTLLAPALACASADETLVAADWTRVTAFNLGTWFVFLQPVRLPSFSEARIHLSRVGSADYYSLPETCVQMPRRKALQAEKLQCELPRHQVQSLLEERFRPADSMEEIPRCKLVPVLDAKNFYDNVAVRNAANCSRLVLSVAKPAIFPHRKSNEGKPRCAEEQSIGEQERSS